MKDQEALIGRVEGASGPDRELDGEIDRLVNSRPKNGDYDAAENAIWQVKDGWSGLLVRSDGFARGSFCALAYTASLDAAATVFPKGTDWSVSNEQGRGVSYTMGSIGEHHWRDRLGATPVLAMLSAALRARLRTDPAS